MASNTVATEPFHVDSSLWNMDNVIITPSNYAADSKMYIDRAVDLFCENLKRYEAGEPLMNEIDMKQS